jgi:hypothetical protein
MVKEWADMVIFANYKTIVVNTDGKGAAKGKNKAQGGRRVMYMTHHVCWDAKNRFGLPEEADFSYEVIRGVVEGCGGGDGPHPSRPAADPPSPEGEGMRKAPSQEEGGGEDPAFRGIPEVLARMMKEAQVTPDEVKAVIAQKGIYPINTSWRTICENEQFMKGWLLHPQVWPQVVNAVKGNREDDEVPF